MMDTKRLFGVRESYLANHPPDFEEIEVVSETEKQYRLAVGASYRTANYARVLGKDKLHDLCIGLTEVEAARLYVAKCERERLEAEAALGQSAARMQMAEALLAEACRRDDAEGEG